MNVEGWVGGDPASVSDNPAGIQGAWYLFGDDVTCAAPSGNPCTAAGCCLDWATIVDSTYESWGCGIGLELNSSGGDSPTMDAYAGTAIGFGVTIIGSSEPNPIRMGFDQTADPSGIVSPFTEVDGPGFYEVMFSDATCPTWAIEQGCTPAVSSSSYTLMFQIPGGDAGAQGQLCITSLVPIFAID